MVRLLNIYILQCKYYLLPLLLLVNSCSVIASNSAGLSFKGNLLDTPPCEIYGTEGIGQPINIQFGEMAIQRIDGQRFQQNWVLNIECLTDLGNIVPLELSYVGSAVLFDEKALETSRAGLGIRLYDAASSDVIAPNDKKKLTMSSNGKLQLPLYSVPVKISKPVTPIVEGKFTATATITINYP